MLEQIPLIRGIITLSNDGGPFVIWIFASGVLMWALVAAVKQFGDVSPAARGKLTGRRAFQEALAVGEPHPRIYNNLALALCKLGKYREALEAFKRSGDEASAYFHLGCIYLAHKKYREAIDASDRTIELSPGFHEKAFEKKQQAEAALSVSALPN